MMNVNLVVCLTKYSVDLFVHAAFSQGVELLSVLIALASALKALASFSERLSLFDDTGLRLSAWVSLKE